MPLIDAIIADMMADGHDVRTIFSYKDNFRQAVICMDDSQLLYSYKERVEVVTYLFVSPSE